MRISMWRLNGGECQRAGAYCRLFSIYPPRQRAHVSHLTSVKRKPLCNDRQGFAEILVQGLRRRERLPSMLQYLNASIQLPSPLVVYVPLWPNRESLSNCPNSPQAWPSAASLEQYIDDNAPISSRDGLERLWCLLIVAMR